MRGKFVDVALALAIEVKLLDEYRDAGGLAFVYNGLNPDNIALPTDRTGFATNDDPFERQVLRRDVPQSEIDRSKQGFDGKPTVSTPRHYAAKVF